jgi:hypothetical protein
MCARVRDPSLLFPATISLVSADNVTRGTSEIDTNCRSSLGRHLQTILTGMFILLPILRLAIFMPVSQFCACLYTPFCLHCFIVHALRCSWGLAMTYIDVIKPVIYYQSVHNVKFVGSPEVAVVSVPHLFQIQNTSGLNLVTDAGCREWCFFFGWCF